MVSALFFSPLGLIALVWLCVLLQWMWPSAPTAVCPTTPEPPPPPPKRHRAPHPLRASPLSHMAMPVGRSVPRAHRPLQPHRRASS